jgi:hypothetical protein
MRQTGAYPGGLIGFNELDSEVADLIRQFVIDINNLKVGTDSLEHLHRDMRGLKKETVEMDLKIMKNEVRNVST